MSGPRISDPIRKAQVGGPYLDIDFPDYFRVDTLTQTGEWLDWGAYYAEQVQRIEDGTYGLLSDGYPFLIRCIADHGDFIVHVDGDGKGEIFYYRIVPLGPSGRPADVSSSTEGISEAVPSPRNTGVPEKGFGSRGRHPEDE